ncbi:hypothetical protein BGW36DRAFT_363351 [Talaromyces proteolyticus]|uniref:Zn(2)-C6 fungal-type domain-containing protein n=1 Tax=Talaromyces proteolyticus TaxID=1131652 RepID=A0AAD4KHD0_9EURO|nr:uncharacterized protein BGW36DRAFT_363351 [Talaromyces proteolyticus]KAH8692358.1 hypothetical protein BGW36DRAFT_363351 [Talaromyces proteolyticus]
MSSAPNDTSLRPRIRIRQACQSCRKRRRKCNGLYPCSQCVAYSYECEYLQGQQDHRPFRRQSSADNHTDHDKSICTNPTTDQHRNHQAEESNIMKEHAHDRNTAHMENSGSSPFIHFPSNSPKTSNLNKNTDYGKAEPRPAVDAAKGRFSNPHSGILLPRRVSRSIDLPIELRFHSYGWNVNTRPEPSAVVNPVVCRWLSFQNVTLYSDIFFEVVDPVYHFISRKRYYERCADMWEKATALVMRASPQWLDLEALVAGVISLGSFFAEDPSPLESQLVDHAKKILDVGCACAPGRLSLDQTAGWILRTLYLRLTTRPHLAWYASCSTMHVVEAMGLHVDLSNVDLAANERRMMTPEILASRKKLLECATFLNAIISADYGRSRVVLQEFPTVAANPVTDLGSSTGLMKLAQILSSLDTSLSDASRIDILSTVKALPDEPPVFVLLKTDVAIHMFRKHVRLESEKLPDSQSKLMLSLIRSALSEVRCLLPFRHAWWNILCTPFQSLMVLLAMDSDESLVLINEAMSILQAVHALFPTYLAAEAFHTAQTLVKGLKKRKMRQVQFLENEYSLSNPKQLNLTGSCDSNNNIDGINVNLSMDPATNLSNSSDGESTILNEAETLLTDWFSGASDLDQLLNMDIFSPNGGQVLYGGEAMDLFNFP